MGNNGSKTGKCAACSQNECERKYENRAKCEDPVNCSCTCQEDTNVTFWKGFGSVVGGVAAFAGGVALTVTTGGLGAVGIVAVIGGGALTGAGASMAIQPVAKKMSGEQMTGVADYFKDVAIGGTIGAVTGPIGLGGTSVTTAIASKVGTEVGKQGAVKFFCRTVVGAVSGVTSSIIQEVANGQFNLGNIAKGAALGAATGGTTHLSGNVVNKVAATGVARSVTKVAADTVSTVVIDASYQGIVDGEIDLKKLALNAGARAATSAGAEAVTNATYKAHGGKDALRDKLGDKKMLDEMDPKDREKAVKAKEFLEKLPSEEVRKQKRLALQMTDEKNNARAGQPPKAPEKMGDQKVHALHSDRVGQFASDLSATDGIDGRGLKRVVFDSIEAKEGTYRYKISGVIDDHDYSKVPKCGDVKAPELKLIKPFILPMAGENDQTPQHSTKNNNSGNRVQQLQRHLTEILDLIRQRIDQNTGTEISPEEMQFQRETFHEIYTIVSELISNSHFVDINSDYQSLSISSTRDEPPIVEIEDKVAIYLYANAQLIGQQLYLDPESACPIILSAEFDRRQRLVLFRRENHRDATNAIYGIRCRICPNRLDSNTDAIIELLSRIDHRPAYSEIGPGHVNYVDQTTRSVHEQLCREQATENEIANEQLVDRPVYEHAVYHIKNNDLPPVTELQDAFRRVMDVILLPTGPINISDDDDLRSWKLFWQFFFRCRRIYFGWNQ